MLLFLLRRSYLTLLPLLALTMCVSSQVIHASPIRLIIGSDSLRFRDTLIPSTITIEHRPLRAGVFGGVGFDRLTMHDATSPLISSCDFFDAGSGTSPYFGVQADIPFWGDVSMWTVVPRLGFVHYGATLSWTELDSTRLGAAVRAHHFQHVLEPSFSGINLTTLFTYHPIGGLELSIGPEILILIGSNFVRHLDALDPGDLIDGQRSRTDQSGSIPKRRLFSAGIQGSLGYELPLSKKLRAIPEVAFDLPFAGLSPNFTATSVHVGIGFQLDLMPRYESIPTYVKQRVAIPPDTMVERIDTTSHRPTLLASVDAFAIEKNGDSSRVLKLSIQEVRSRSAYPILNYIFFDEGSSKLPQRFVRYTTAEEAHANFKSSDERRDIKLLDLYRETLNILGERLQRSPRCTVTLTGCTSNTGPETDRLDLARARAEEVKHYLTSIWRVDASRIRISARLLPERSSPTDIPQGAQENRRVEIDVSDPSILDPVMVLKTERLATPPNIRIIPHITADTTVLKIHTALSGGGKELLTSESGPSATRNRSVWQLDEDVLEQLSDSLYLSLDVQDAAGSVVHAHKAIPLTISHLTTENKEGLSRFSLILFGFDESSVGTKNKRVLGRIVSALSALKPNEVSVVGYTDEMGDAQHNQELSRERAQAAASEIAQLITRMKLPALERILTEGRGSREVLYDNSLPEGRFFSRTVNITIEGSTK